MSKLNKEGFYQCTICSEIKPIGEFHKDRTAKKGHGSRCRPCGTKYRLNIVHKNPEHYRLKNNEYARKLRLKIVARYGDICVCCGETEEEFLTVDHIHGDGAEHRKIVSSGTAFYKTIRREKFPKDKYQLLCRNCNWSKGTGPNGKCIHTRNSEVK